MAQTTASATEKEEKEKADLIKNAEEGKNERGQKLKPGYLEMLTLLTLSMVTVTSPLPLRTERAKNDCMASFGGPLTLMLMKIMGAVHILGEAKAFFQYSKLSKKVTELNTTETDSVGTGTDGENQKVQNHSKGYKTLKILYEGQKEVLSKKEKFHKIMRASLITAAALEASLLATCSGICFQRNAKFISQKFTLETYITSHITNLESNAALIQASNLPAYAPGPPLPSTSVLATKALITAISSYKAAVIADLSAQIAASTAISSTVKLNQLAGWKNLFSIWQALLPIPSIPVSYGPEFTNKAEEIIGGGVLKAEETAELTLMTKNESLTRSRQAATYALAQAVQTAEIALNTALPIEQKAMAALCADLPDPTGAAQSACITGVNLAYSAFQSYLKTYIPIMEGAFKTSKGLDVVVNRVEDVLSHGFGNRIASLEKILLAKTKLLDPSALVGNQLKNLAEDELKKIDPALLKNLGLIIPYMNFSEYLLDKGFSCCGSGGRLMGEPNKRIPIPKLFGIVSSRRDMKPKNLLKAVTHSKWENDVIEMAFANYQFEENNRLENLKQPLKSEKNLAKEFYFHFLGAINKIYENVGIPKVYADSDFEKKLDKLAPGLGIAGIMLAFKFRKYVKKIYDFATKSPRNRTAFFTLLIGLNELLVKRAEDRTTEVNDHISKLNKLIEKIDKNDSQSNSIATTDENTFNPYENTGIAPLPKAGEIKPFECANVGDDSFEPTDCSNAKSSNFVNNNEEFKLLRNQMPEFASALNNLGGLASNMASSNNGQAFSDANINSMGAMSAAMRKKAKTALSQIKQIDSLDEDKKDDLNKMISDAFNPFLAAGVSGMPNLATDGVMTASIAPPSSLTDKKDKAEDSSTGAVAIPSLNDPAGGFGAIDGSLPTEEVPTDTPTDGTQSTSSLDQFEVPENDIIKEKDKSIFEALSDRYLLSYPKILKKAEPTPAGM